MKCPEKGKDLVTTILTLATAESLSVDIRDRAFLYWRLLSSAPDIAKRIVLSTKPHMNLQYEEVMDDDLLYTMLEELGSVSSVYYRPAEEFIHPVTGPSPVQTNSPIPDEDLDLVEDNSETDSDDSDSSDDIDIFADEEKEPDTQPAEEEDTNQSEDEEHKERDSFDDIFN